MPKANVICRCEEIEIDEIRKWIAYGCTDFEELKRILRVSMGPCQGRGCRDIIMREIAKATGKPVGELRISTIRPPVKPIKTMLLADED
ncbi:MAG: (2Fe-2S)-binding protein [Synergistes sp.]|nr:(2Fe-2S)-binding protein [Synergistes sp.]